jgi:quercetin dioxygenase-like cupin family protein
MSAEAVIRMPGEGKELTLAGKPLAFLVTGEDSKHTCMFEWTVPAGFSTGLHVHRVQEETFYVLEGECEWQIGDQLVRAKPGAYVFIPPGVPHNIGNASDKPARMIMTVSPPGHEHYFEELAQLVARGGPPECQCHRGIEKPLRHRAAISAKNQVAIIDRIKEISPPSI